jgi:Bacterial Ig-like domain
MRHATVGHSSRVHRQLACLTALALLWACADSAGPRNVEGRPETKALISTPTPASVTEAAAASGRTYVSMAPGTEPGGDSVTIVRLGGGLTVGTGMVDGGFDPIALQADVGDTLAISIHHGTGNSSTTYGVVPVKGRPVIVRTSPVDGRTDVPLNCVIQVVFSEPMDSLSLVNAMHLQLDGLEVPGTVSWTVADGDVLVAEFVPADSLRPASSYQFSVSTAARDQGGGSLAAPLRTRFVTQATDSGGSQLPLAKQILSIFPTGAPAGSHDVSLTLMGYFTGTDDQQSYAVRLPERDTTALQTTPVDGGASLHAVIPAALLTTPGGVEVFVYTKDPSGKPIARSNSLTFEVTSPLPSPGTAELVVKAPDVPPSPGWPRFPGHREVSLDGGEPRMLFELDSLTFSGLSAGDHRLDLSNPCSGTHQPTTMQVTLVADATVTLTVYVPPDCE